MSKYLYDEYGNKYEGMDKNEILETMGATEPRQYVFTGEVTYNNEPITFEYSGVRPSDSQIVSLLSCATDFSLGLSASEIIALKAIGEFKIHVMLCEYDVYITNGHCDLIYIFNTGLGFRKLYENGQNKASYYMTSSEPVNDVRFVTKAEFNNIIIDANTTYVITDEDFTQNVLINMTLENNEITYPDDLYDYFKNNANDRIIIKLNIYLNSFYLRFGSLYKYSTTGNETYKFFNDSYTIDINFTYNDNTVTTAVTIGDTIVNELSKYGKIGDVLVEEIFCSDDADKLIPKVQQADYADWAGNATRAGCITTKSINVDSGTITETGLYAVEAISSNIKCSILIYISDLNVWTSSSIVGTMTSQTIMPSNVVRVDYDNSQKKLSVASGTIVKITKIL